MASQCFNYLGKNNHRTQRLIERSRRFKLRVKFMNEFSMSQETAKELTNEYQYKK